VRALLIQHPHIDKILAGTKTWEMRGSNTFIREQIALIASGSGAVIGVCDLVDSFGPLTQTQFSKNAKKAGMRPSEAKLGHYRQTFAWVVWNARTLTKPVPYKHPPGAIIWVKLDAKVEKKIKAHIAERERK
jgi:hypothetical protein